MHKCVKLPLTFNPDLLADDAQAIPEADWEPHFNLKHYEGDWSGTALRSPDGQVRNTSPGKPGARNVWYDTPLLARCPNLAAVVDAFECGKASVRLLRLGPGTEVKEHRDDPLRDHKIIRIHVPVLTNPDAELRSEGRRVPMLPGETWYVDFGLPHSVANHGSTPRVHLILDCFTNGWLRGQLDSGTPYP